jgi:flagellar biosynthesis regulator FlbT
MKTITINLPVTIGINASGGEEQIVDMFVQRLRELDNNVRDMRLFDVFDIDVASGRMEISEALRGAGDDVEIENEVRDF